LSKTIDAEVLLLEAADLDDTANCNPLQATYRSVAHDPQRHTRHTNIHANKWSVRECEFKNPVLSADLFL
jgi:hypothetical protein